MFFFLECPWISQTRNTSRSSWNFFNIYPKGLGEKAPYSLHVKDAWMKLPIRVDPLSIQVDASKVATSVTVDDSIWVEHGDDLKYKVVSEDPSAKTWSHEVVNDTLDHEGGAGLSRMHTGGYYHALPLFDLLSRVTCTPARLRCKACYDKHVNIISRESLAQDLPSKAKLLARVSFQSIKIPL
jgi:hypothetical protein